MRQLLTPRMIALHVLVLAVLAVLVSLGSWQLQRLGEASARADAITDRLQREPVPIGQLLDGLTTAETDRLEQLEFRPVTATGRWRPDDEVLQRGRAHGGLAGLGLLTPLELDDGTTVLVRRGTVPFDNELRPPVAAAAPAAGTVTVTGTLERPVPQPDGGLAQRDPDEGDLEVVFNTDLDRLGRQLPEPLRPMLLRVDPTTTTPGQLPLPPPRPAPDRGPHLSYAVQWFSFALIGAGMYVLWLVRRARLDERAVTATGRDHV